MRWLAALFSGYLRALGTLLRSLAQSLGGRLSLLFSLFFVALLAVLLLLGTEPGRVALTRTAIYAAGKLVPDLDIRAPEIGSAHLGAWQFPQLRVDYRNEVLLQARDLALDFDLGGLLHNRINIETIAAGSLRLDNNVLDELLQAQGSDDTEEETQQPLSLPQVRLASLRLERLEVVDRRQPDLPVVSVTSSGLFRWRDNQTYLRLEMRELNGHGLHFELNGREVAEQRLLLEFRAREASGGFASRYLQLPQGQALDARGRIRLWQPRDDRLQVDVEEFSVPLVDHHFSLTGRSTIALSPWKVTTKGLALKVDDTQHHIAGSVSADAVDAEIKLNRLPLSISQPWQDYLRGGWLSADLSVRGPLSLPAVSGLVDLKSRYRDQPLRLQTRVQTRDQVITLDAATLDFADARLEAGGNVDVGRRAIDLKGRIDQLTLDQLRHLLAALPGTGEVEIPADLGGTVEQLQVSAEGPWDNPRIDASLRASPVYRQFPAQLKARVKGDLRELALSDLQLQSDGLSVSGGGKVAIADEALQLQLRLKARDFRPAELLGLAAAEGVVVNMDTELAVDGPWKNPQIHAQIQSDGIYRDTSENRYRYHYTLRGGAAGDLQKITLDHLRLELAGGEGAAQPGARALRGPQSLLPPREPESENGAPVPQQSPLPRKGSSVAALAKESRQLGGNAWLEVSGVIEPAAARAEGTVAGRNIPVSLAELAGVELPPSLTGTVSIEGRFSGPFIKPEATANLLALGEFRSEPWQLQGNVHYGGGSIDLSEVELVWAERNQLSAQGSLNAKQFSLEIRGRGHLADWQLDLPVDLADRGEVTLRASAAGSPRHPLLDGELKLVSGATDGAEANPLDLVLGWQTQGENLNIALDAARGERKAVDMRGQLAVAPILSQLFAERPAGAVRAPLPLKFSSSGSADLSVLGAFIDPEIHAMRGQLDFALDADGNLDKPNFDGRIELKNGDYEHRPSNTRLRHIELLARLTPDAWRIERAHADDGEKGSLDLGGAVRFAAGAPPVLDFELNTHRLHLLNMPAVRGAVSGTLKLAGTAERAEVAGKLTLRPLSVQIEQLIGSSVPEIEVVEVEVDGPQVVRGPPLLEKIALAIEVVVDQQSYVRGLGLNSELRGEVDIAGTAAKPLASGELKIVRGNFDLLGKRFELQEGQVQFENNVAALYVKGRYEYSEGEITAEISGSLTGARDDVKVTFSSTPAAAQDEIFARLLFGKSLSDISPLQAVRLVSVVRTLQSGGSAFDPVAKTRELLGVDTLDLEREASEDGDQYALSLGKYITNRIYIELQRSTDPLNPWEAKMQIELRHNLNLQVKSADNDESGAGSVELQWKKDY